MANLGAFVGQLLISLAIGIIVAVCLRYVRPLKKWPALPFWTGAAFALLPGLVTYDRSFDTIAVSALASCIIVLRHYLTLPKQAVK